MTNIGSQLVDAATLMLTGMLVVFVFLSILIVLVQLLSKIAPKEEVVSAPVKRNTSTKANNQNSSGVDPKTVAAISAAVHKYRATSAK
jgi:oxaloacetate decarboxylase gamma subunit